MSGLRRGVPFGTAAGTLAAPCWAMDNPEKCAHPACNCIVPKGAPFGKFCSEHCQTAKQLAELRCECGHDGCK
jgi:hypothetical protein